MYTFKLYNIFPGINQQRDLVLPLLLAEGDEQRGRRAHCPSPIGYFIGAIGPAPVGIGRESALSCGMDAKPLPAPPGPFANLLQVASRALLVGYSPASEWF